MSESFAICHSMEELQRALRARAEHLQISREIIDEVAGVTKGYAAKVLCEHPNKNLGLVSMFPMIGALGLKVVLTEDNLARARIERQPKRTESHVRKDGAHWRNAQVLRMITEMAQKWGSIGGRASAKRLSKRARRLNARNAALARWQRKRAKE